MISENSKRLKKIIEENLKFLIHDGGGGRNPVFPNYDLLPFDYIKFAENELNNFNNNSEAKINCVNHLKRAIDCELDTFFYVLGLNKIIKKKNLKFESKLKFIENIGILNSKSLGRFNTIRNKIEHEYTIPQIEDIEVYYDLTYSFVSLLESYIFMMSNSTKIEAVSNLDNKNISLSICYKFDSPEINYIFTNSENKVDEFNFNTTNIIDFEFALRVYFLLIRWTTLISDDYVLLDIEDFINKN